MRNIQRINTFQENKLWFLPVKPSFQVKRLQSAPLFTKSGADQRLLTWEDAVKSYIVKILLYDNIIYDFCDPNGKPEEKSDCSYGECRN